MSLSISEKKKIVLPKEKIVEKINTEEDFIWSHKFDYSLKKYLEINTKPAHDHYIARLLKLKKSEVSKIFKTSLKKMKTFLQTENEE